MKFALRCCKSCRHHSNTFEVICLNKGEQKVTIHNAGHILMTQQRLGTLDTNARLLLLPFYHRQSIIIGTKSLLLHVSCYLGNLVFIHGHRPLWPHISPVLDTKRYHLSIFGKNQSLISTLASTKDFHVVHFVSFARGLLLVARIRRLKSFSTHSCYTPLFCLAFEMDSVWVSCKIVRHGDWNLHFLGTTYRAAKDCI